MALIVARGLLEFAVADLDPGIFQKVLLARLQRMETDQATALDNALLDLHSDLASSFDSVQDQLRRVLDRLPPGPARRGEIGVYLRALISWLNADPWPRDQQFAGNVLTPAAIERSLRVTVTGGVREESLAADKLARQCRRLVILSGPGSGKTWLAKRTARRGAEDALEALAEGKTLDEVELPLYTTCSRLFSAAGDIRAAAVSSALDQLGDLGGSRLSTALRAFFAERNAPTVLVIDSLDEAHGDDARLFQADTLPWRIVLTSRPGSWNHQLAIPQQSGSHQIGELQPLRYPDDVEPFIRCWFDERPDWGEELAAQIARRPGLQQAATVPLILAFYCIVGGGKVLPEFMRDLYPKVLRRMLTGRWHGNRERQADADTCLHTLQAWAWAGATSHPISGVGMWVDDIPTGHAPLGEADEIAVSHVAPPVGPPDIDTGKTLRRFIHRSIREHLVAEYVAGLPADEAASALLPHLWHDRDWEYAAPAALAAHPQRDQLLRVLISCAAGSDQIPPSLSALDGAWQLRRLLARVASESTEADWSPENARMIGQARVELAQSGHAGGLNGAARWEASNSAVREALLGLLAREARSWNGAAMARWLAWLDPTTEDKRRARQALLRLLARETDEFTAADLVRAVVQLGPTPQDRHRARTALLRAVDHKDEDWPTDDSAADELIEAVARLAPAAQDRHLAREALLAMLSREVSRSASSPKAETLVQAMIQLAPTAEDKRHARQGLLGLLARVSCGWSARALADGVVQLARTAEDKRQARENLLRLLAPQASGLQAVVSAGGLIGLGPTAEDKYRARAVLLGVLAREALLRVLTLAALLGELAREARLGIPARALLLGLLEQTNGFMAAELVKEIVRLDPTTEDKHQASEAVLGLLACETNGFAAAKLADSVVRLNPAAEDKRQAREAVLRLLARETSGFAAAELAGELIRLDPTTEDRHRASQAMLGILDHAADALASGA